MAESYLQNRGSNCLITTTEPKKDQSYLVPSMKKMVQLMPTVPASTLLERSAQVLAKAWMQDSHSIPDFDDAAFQSQMGLIFKIQIALYLEGIHLVKWIQSQNGLEQIAQDVWPDLFQKLLTVMFYQMEVSGRFCIENSIRLMLEKYMKHVQSSPVLQHTLHRLGLTSYFRHGKISGQNKLMLFYYWYLEDRTPNFRGTLPMVYPLPFALQCRSMELKDFRKILYANAPAVQNKKQEWSQSVTAEELLEENEGRAISFKTNQQQKALYQSYCENYTSLERFMSCISTMVRSQVNGAYPVVLVTALLSLLHPFYSGKHELNYPMVKMFRIDIFWFLSRALCSFHAQLDLPLACLRMAQLSIGPAPCLSEQMHYALCYQTIAIHYGQWEAAAKVLNEWFYCVPPVSWLFEEFVYNQIVGYFWRMENLLAEMYINKILHRDCRKVCWKHHFRVPLIKLKSLKLKVLGISYKCFSYKMAQKNFHKNLQVVIYLCGYFDITLQKIEREGSESESNFDEQLKIIWQRLERCTEFYISRHLTPFMRILPYYAGSPFFWDHLIQSQMDTAKRVLQSFSLMDTPKLYADRLFSTVVSLLYHYHYDSFSHMIQATLQAYEKSTAGRHYRIPLLRKLLCVHGQPSSHQLKIESSGGDEPHSSLPPHEISVINMTYRDIEAFSATARDARDDFAHIDLANDEKFVMYMKKRDPLMPAWIDLGLDGLRFADCL